MSYYGADVRPWELTNETTRFDLCAPADKADSELNLQWNTDLFLGKLSAVFGDTIQTKHHKRSADRPDFEIEKEHKELGIGSGKSVLASVHFPKGIQLALREAQTKDPEVYARAQANLEKQHGKG